MDPFKHFKIDNDEDDGKKPFQAPHVEFEAEMGMKDFYYVLFRDNNTWRNVGCLHIDMVLSSYKDGMLDFVSAWMGHKFYNKVKGPCYLIPVTDSNCERLRGEFAHTFINGVKEKLPEGDPDAPMTGIQGFLSEMLEEALGPASEQTFPVVLKDGAKGLITHIIVEGKLEKYEAS